MLAHHGPELWTPPPRHIHRPNSRDVMRSSPFSGFGFGAGPRQKKVAAAGGGWSPPDASVTLRAWYRPDLGLTEAGGLVSAWLDQSGQGDANRNQSAAGAARPGYTASDAAYGNKPVVTGNGSQVMTAGGAWSWAPNPAITILVVGEAAASSSFLGDSTTNNMVYANATPNEAVYGAVAGANVGTGNPATPCAVMYTDSGSGGSAANIYINDLDTPTFTGATIFDGATRLDLLSGFGGGFGSLVGKLAEIIVWGGVINATDKGNIVTYLNATRAYGLGIT